MESILYNARLFSEKGENDGKTALLIRDGHIALTGTDAAVLKAAAPGCERTDMKGAYVYPGLCDSHLHILNKAYTDSQLVLEGMKSREEVLEAVRRQAQTLPSGARIDGRGYNEDLWADRRPIVKAELDAICPDRAVRLTRVCGHKVIANTKALEEKGMTGAYRPPVGGTVDPETGTVTENAVFDLFCGDENPGVEDCMQKLLQGMCYAADLGLTAIFSDDLASGPYGAETVYEAYRRLDAEGRMPVRVVEQCALATDEEMEAWAGRGRAYMSGSDFFRLGPRKLFADGSLGAGTAWLRQPYADRDGTGVCVTGTEKMKKLFVTAHRLGYPCIVHAIGDGAVQCVLEAASYAKSVLPEAGNLPDGIVHCQITGPDQLERIREEGLCVYAQPVFAEYDLHICASRVGTERESTSYAWKTLYDSGVTVSSGSDCPVEDASPAGNIYCASERRDYQGFPASGWLPAQRLTRREAILCHTVMAARCVGMEDRMGRIAPGYFADFSVYSEDLETVSAERLLRLRPLMTVVNGKIRLQGTR